MATRFILPLADVGNGISPSDGAQLFFFVTGSSTVKRTIFSDQAGENERANPAIADGDGLFPEIFIVGSYKVILEDKNGVQIFEVDPVTGEGDVGSSIDDFGAIGDGDGNGGGTDNAIAIQNAMNSLLANGGTLSASAGKTYRCDSPITLIRTATADAEVFIIDFRGAKLDFENLTGTEIGFTIGATSSAFFKDSGKIVIRDIDFTGPESLNPATVANDPTTTTVGLRTQFAGNVQLENVRIARFHTGYQSEFVFPLASTNVIIVSCWIGCEFWDASNTQAWVGLNVTNFRYAVLIHSKQGANDFTINTLTFYSPRWESGINVMTVDMGSDTSHPLRGLGIYEMFMAQISETPFRFCKTFTFATPTVNGVDSVGQFFGIQWHGGHISELGTLVSGDKTNNSIVGGVVSIPYNISLIDGDCNFTQCDVTGYRNHNISHDTITRMYNPTSSEYINFNRGTDPFIGMTATSAGGEMRLNKDQDGESFIEINNSNAGTSSSASFRGTSEVATVTLKATSSTASPPNAGVVGTLGANPFIFFINNAEVARFLTQGELLINATAKLEGNEFLHVESDNAVVQTWKATTSTASDNSLFFYSDVTSTDTIHMRMFADGDFVNTNGTYGMISDGRLKKVLGPATSQWEDVKNIELVRFQLLAELENDPDARILLGTVAQQLEEVCPGLVKQANDEMGIRSVKNSIMHMKGFGALQEAMERIEQLEADVKDLKEK